MKKIIFGAIALGFMFTAVSCGSSKKLAATPEPVPSGMTAEAMPLSGPAYRSDADFFRAVQNGVSTERGMAQKIGMQNCRQELASLIQAGVSAVIENYARNEATPLTAEYEAQYQEMAYTVVRQQLRDVQVVDEKLFSQADGQYRYYVCLQMSKDALEAALEAAATRNAKLNLQFDRAKFKQIYDEQMAAFSQE